MTDSEDKIKKLNVRFKAPPSEDQPTLQVVDRGGCDHRSIYVNSGGLGGRFVDVQYKIRDGETEVECGNCGTRLDPMWVLKILARREHGWHQKREVANEEMKRLEQRTSTKCRHCGKMTRISRR